jgi:pullulanase/glycogen debranching enzyme
LIRRGRAQQGRAATSLYGFTAALVSLRRRRPELLAQGEYVGKGTLRWLGRFLSEPNWADPQERVVAFMLRPNGASEGLGGGLYVAFNTSAQQASVTLPAPPAGATEWLRIVDSSALPPADAMEFIIPHATKTYTLPPSRCARKRRAAAAHPTFALLVFMRHLKLVI